MCSCVCWGEGEGGRAECEWNEVRREVRKERDRE